MLETRTYSIADLHRLTGFDRRTIVYYIQQGLVPKAGRRGPNTRYPSECLLRLRFIRALKDLQDQGQCGTITLRDIHRVMAPLDAATLMGMLERGPPVAEVEQLLAGPASPPPPPPPPPPPSPPSATPAALPPRVGVTGPSGERRSYGLADAGIRQRLAAGGTTAAPPRPSESAPPQPPPVAQPALPPGELGDLLRELEVRPGLAGRRLAPGASEYWTEIPITSRIFLSVRGLSADDAPLADAAARELKKLLRVR